MEAYYAVSATYYTVVSATTLLSAIHVKGESLQQSSFLTSPEQTSPPTGDMLDTEHVPKRKLDAERDNGLLYITNQ